MGWFDVVKAPFSLANRALFDDYLNWGRGGIIGTPINYILENPGKSALIAVGGVATGGVGAAAGSAGTAATIGTASAVAGGAATKSYLSAAALSATGCINTGSGTTIAIQQLARYSLMGFVAPVDPSCTASSAVSQSTAVFMWVTARSCTWTAMAASRWCRVERLSGVWAELTPH